MSIEQVDTEKNFVQPKITDDSQLSTVETDLMNRVKQKETELGDLIAEVRAHHNIDQRWVSIGVTNLQQGFMAVVRGIAQPVSNLK